MLYVIADNLIATGIVIGSAVIGNQMVKYGILRYRRMKIRDYNRFVHTTYTQHAKQTPPMILRIQNDYIRRYNSLLKYCRFLSCFFKEIDYFGGPARQIVELIPADNPKADAQVTANGI